MFILSSQEEKHRVVNLFIVVVHHSNKQNTIDKRNKDSNANYNNKMIII